VLNVAPGLSPPEVVKAQLLAVGNLWN